jgi:hypothetical protein
LPLALEFQIQIAAFGDELAAHEITFADGAGHGRFGGGGV